MIFNQLVIPIIWKMRFYNVTQCTKNAKKYYFILDTDFCKTWFFGRNSKFLYLFSRAAAAQEAEISSMPTFINLPPPYSEQPSPLYNLCASSINSEFNHCCHHYQHLCFNQEAPSSSSQSHCNKEVNNEEDTNSTADTTTDTTTTSAF